MYSVVLLTALTVGTATPAHGGLRNGHSGYAPYSTYSCYGCYGCGGCYGSYAPYSSYSGYGSYGSYAPYSSYSGYGCYGCYGCGGCGGYIPHYGCHGAGFGYHGGCYGAYGAWTGDGQFGGCFGCHGGHSAYGIPLPIPDVRGGAGTGAGVVDPFPPINPGPKVAPGGKEEEIGIPKEKKGPGDKKIDDKKPEQQSRVKVRIDVPEGARLFVDGHRIQTTGARVFQTPLLAPGQKYFYDIRIETERDGQTVSEQRRVIVEPGIDVAVAFPNLTPGTATARAPR